MLQVLLEDLILFCISTILHVATKKPGEKLSPSPPSHWKPIKLYILLKTRSIVPVPVSVFQSLSIFCLATFLLWYNMVNAHNFRFIEL